MRGLRLRLGLSRRGGAVSAYAAYALALDFDNPEYWVSGTQYTPHTAIPGYAFTGAGTKGAVNAAGAVAYSALDAPAINSAGYHAYGALTNLTPDSQTLGNWNLSTNVSQTADTQVAPDGTTTADTLTGAAGTVEKYAFQSTTYTAAPHTFSCFAKQGTQRFVQLLFGNSANGTAYANFDLQLGTKTAEGGGGTGYIVPCTNGWYRLVLVGTTAAVAGVAVSPAFIDNGTALRAPTHSGGSTNFHLWQQQTLLGNFPDGGPIIVTAAATASIGASALEVNSAPVDQTQLFFCPAIRRNADTADAFYYQMDDGTNANRIVVFQTGAFIQCYVIVGSVIQLDQTVARPAVGVECCPVVLRSGGNWRFGKVEGGVLTWAAAAVAGTYPAMTKANPGCDGTGTGQFSGAIKGLFVKPMAATADADILAAVAAVA